MQAIFVARNCVTKSFKAYRRRSSGLLTDRHFVAGNKGIAHPQRGRNSIIAKPMAGLCFANLTGDGLFG